MDKTYFVRLEGETQENVEKIAQLKGITGSEFLSVFLQESTMISEFLEEEIEDLEEH